MGKMYGTVFASCGCPACLAQEQSCENILINSCFQRGLHSLYQCTQLGRKLVFKKWSLKYTIQQIWSSYENTFQYSDVVDTSTAVLMHNVVFDQMKKFFTVRCRNLACFQVIRINSRVVSVLSQYCQLCYLWLC